MNHERVAQVHNASQTTAPFASGILQRLAVNHSVQSEVPAIVHEVLLSSGRPLDSPTRVYMEPRFSQDFIHLPVRSICPRVTSSSLEVGARGDRYEQEADQIAEQVMRVPPSGPKNNATRCPRFNFSQVRVHTDARVAESARVMNAEAYTIGRNIVFGTGNYAPNTMRGETLLAHELTHVVQQQNNAELQSQVRFRGAGTFGGFFSNIGRAIAEFFTGEEPSYEEDTLEDYLQALEDTNAIVGDFDSDNKARAVVQQVRNGSSRFNRTPRIKTLLIIEMQSGFTGDDDEEAILYLLTTARESELEVMFGSGGIDPRALNADFHGVQKRRLLQFYQQRFEGGLAAVLQNRIRPLPALDPHDSMVVQRARRLAVLERILAETLAVEAERTSLLSRRREMDRTAADLGPPQARAQMEERNLESLNRRPLHISVTEHAVMFRVRFHVRFEDPAMANRFGILEQSLREGINLVWNQRLSGGAFGGRRFFIEPVIRHVGPNDPRDHNYWLVTVRSVNRGQVNYPGCRFDPLPAGVPTSATMSSCDGGVMSIPPAHVDNPGVLGHELLHLFGLVDRYMLVLSRTAPGGRITGHQMGRTRQTGGRGDPLGGEDATILAEDLAFLFEHLGVYESEIRRLTQGRGVGWLRVEIERQREIIRLGHDPRSLIRFREDFNRELLRSVEDL